MRFTYTLAAGALALLPWATSAQDAAPEEGTPAVEAAAAPFKQDEPCMREITPELTQSFGEAVAWPDDGHALYTPEGLSVLGHAVSYVLVKQRGDAIEEIDYRLDGLQRKVGQPHDGALLRTFDKEFDKADCADSKESSCGVLYRGDTSFTGAEIGSGELYVSSSARGPKLALVKSDYDLLDADPVFLVCFYRGDS